MAFRFNFSSPAEETFEVSSEQSNENISPSSVPCEYLTSSKDDFKAVSPSIVKSLKYGQFEIKYITHRSVTTDNEKISVIEKANSDLLPGKYEGGLKVWECALDLTQFLVETSCIKEKDTVLELGCGVGLPGILCYLSGAPVTFQDYNSEVLNLVTMTNVLLNTKDNISEKCKFLCGDWHAIREKFYGTEQNPLQYDIILTSETIYNKSNQLKLLGLMKAALKPTGVIYLASKVHYFGVGGGILDFEQLLIKDGSFQFSTVFKTEEGVERQILKLMWKS